MERQQKIVALLFLTILAILVMPGISLQYGLIEDRPLIQIRGIELTTGDVVTLFSLFGTCAGIAMWWESRRR